MADIMKHEVTLQEWLSGNCPYQGCRHNAFGSCEYEDEDFIDEMERLVQDINIDKNKEIIPCKPDIPDNVCDYCGEELISFCDTVEYWGAKIPMGTRYCKNGC